MPNLKITFKDDQGIDQEATVAIEEGKSWLELSSEYFISVGLDPDRYSEGELIE